MGSPDKPTIQPTFAIPTEEGGSNHTEKFAESAKAEAAHDATIAITKCLSVTALRVLIDEAFFQEVSSPGDEINADKCHCST